MPRGNPKRHAVLRLDPELMDAVRELAGPGGFTAAVEEGLRWWITKQKRRPGKTDPLARHLVPPTARELAARKGD
jgi:hypothetical protein